MHWRKTSWAIAVWTVLMLLLLFGSASDADSSRGAAETIVYGGLVVVLPLWLVGMVPLSIAWALTRPKANVTVYGPNGETVALSEKEAARRVRTGAWSYRQPEVR